MRAGVRGVIATLIAVLVVASACGGSSPAVPLGADGEPDPVLEAGRVVYGQQCASCHGAEGQGGRGKKLNDGRAAQLHPEIDSMITVIAEGKGNGMPAFEAKLDGDEIAAVSRYVLEVLS